MPVDKVTAKIENWQSALIDLTRRNPLYALSPKARGLLPLTDLTPDALYLLLVRRRKMLQIEQSDTNPSSQDRNLLGEIKPPKPGHLGVAEAEFKTLNALRLRAASALREQGINILFITMGMLEWIDPASGGVLRSPLLLVPAALERLPGGDAFRLTRLEDEIEVNPTLRFRLSQSDIQITLPELPEEEDLTPSTYLAAVEALLPQRPGWKLTSEMVVGRFSFLKMTMYRDLVAQAERARQHPVIAALAGDRSALEQLLAVELPTVESLDTVTSGERAYQVLDADPTQQRAILAAKRGQSFVLQGPPGTGKTQTIANIITECVAAGKRVLFVSQKMAALDAVFKRLRDKGLADLCLEAHSHKANKKEVLEQLRRSLNARQHAIQGDDPQTEELETVRAALAEVVQALHTPWQPLGLSVYGVNGIVAEASGVLDLPFVSISPELVTAEQYRQMEMLAERLAGYHSLFAEIGSHPWRGIRATRFTLDLQTAVRTVFGDLYHQVESLGGEAGTLAGLCGIDAPQSFASADHLIQVGTAAAKSPRPPRTWLVSSALADTHFASLRQTASACEARYRAHDEAKAALRRTWSAEILTLPHADLLERLGAKHETALKSAFGSGWMENLAQSYPEITSALGQAVEKIERLQRGLSGLTQLSGRSAALTLSAARNETAIAELACQDPRPLAQWFSLGALRDLERRSDEASGIYQSYHLKKSQLFAAYTQHVLALDLSGLQGRFAADYDTFWKYLKPAFYRDSKVIRLTLRPETPRSGRDLLADLALAEEVRSQAAWIQAHDDELGTAFGSHYQGLDTDWGKLREALRQTGRMIEACASRVSPALMQRLIASGLELQALNDQHRAVRSQLQETDDAFGALGQWVDLTQLPFTNLPLSQALLEELAAWLRLTGLYAGDYAAARQQALRCFSSLTALPMPKDLVNSLKEAQRLVQEEDAIVAESSTLEAQYQSLYHGQATDWAKVLVALDWTEQLRQLLPGKPIPEGLLAVVTEASAPLLADIAAASATLQQRRDSLQPLLDKLSDFFPPERLYIFDQPQNLSLAEASLAAVSTWLKVHLERLPDLERWIGFQNLRDQCSEAGLLSFFETAINRRPPQDQILPAFRKQFHRLWLDGVTDRIPVLRQFRGEDHARQIARFCRLDVRQIELAPDGVRTLALGHKLNVISTFGEMGALKTQLNRQRPKAIRKLLADIPNLLFLLKPCLLMSPLSVSLFLESETIWFDTVIFDEASQVLTEDAVGAILRAKQVVIAGDTQQLPPTSFFQSFADDGEGDEDGDGSGDFESVLKASDTFADSESPYFAEHPLNWHYRSRHESLIAFSKVNFYKQLIPYPSSSLPSAVTFEYVSEGIYYPGKGARRNNPVEAARVADLVIRHLNERPEQSVGVITFNEPQQTTILAEIERRKQEAPHLASLLSEDGSEGFFVKNIENVQGDERDVIFLSLGFGHDPAGRLSMNFGPLNSDGGERRLNVAVTRARCRMTVVASIRPGEIDLSRTGKKGPELLKAYLEFAESGSQGSGPMRAGPARPQSEFERVVETALRGQGYQVRRQVGLFDYRVDLAIVDEEDPSHYLLGLECDGPMYRDAPTARARERLRPQVLQALGWHLLRLWSSDWVRDPARELDKIAALIVRIKAGEPVAEEMAAVPPPAPPSIAAARTVSEEHGSYQTSVPPQDADLAQEINRAEAAAFVRWKGALPGGRTAFYSEEKADAAARAILLLEIVETEGPLPLETATLRLAESAGIARAGARVQEVVEETAETLSLQEKIDIRCGFLWPHGLERPAPRVSRPPELARLMEQICLEEIGEASILLLKVAYGMRRDELIVETARLMGYRNTGANIRDRINEALSALELDNRIQVVGDQIRALEI